MKILKQGKVEKRKFVCEKCGCVFVANTHDRVNVWNVLCVFCPTCSGVSRWEHDEPYEEPTQDVDAGKDKLKMNFKKSYVNGKSLDFLAREWFKMSNDAFFAIYGFNFNPHNYPGLYEYARKQIYGK